MTCTDFVQANATSLLHRGRPLFLDGLNLAWISYGTDFVPSAATGSGLTTYCELAEAMRFVREQGGNALRVWLFAEPHRARRADGSLRDGVVDMVRTMLSLAAEYSVYIVPVLFNGALVRHASDCAIFGDEAELQAVIDTIVVPLATAVRGYSSLAMWEVVNEPEGLLDTSQLTGGTECTDVSTALSCPTSVSQPGWNGACRFGIQQLQRLVNRVAAALRRASPHHLVTMGSWSHCVSTLAPGAVNLWSDACLVAAGGEAAGTLDVHQLHSYPKLDGGTRFHPSAPPMVDAATYGLDRPVLVGEVSTRWVQTPAGGEPTSTARGTTEATLFASLRRRGYAGVFGWAYTCNTQYDGGCVGRSALAEGLRAAAAAADELPAPPTSVPRLRNYQCACGHAANEEHWGYACKDQAAWGKCTAMQDDGACAAWCDNCGEPLSALADARESRHGCIDRVVPASSPPFPLLQLPPPSPPPQLSPPQQSPPLPLPPPLLQPQRLLPPVSEERPAPDAPSALASSRPALPSRPHQAAAAVADQPLVLGGVFFALVVVLLGMRSLSMAKGRRWWRLAEPATRPEAEPEEEPPRRTPADAAPQPPPPPDGKHGPAEVEASSRLPAVRVRTRTDRAASRVDRPEDVELYEL